VISQSGNQLDRLSPIIANQRVGNRNAARKIADRAAMDSGRQSARALISE
jgi:hypothetical protein